MRESTIGTLKKIRLKIAGKITTTFDRAPTSTARLAQMVARRAMDSMIEGSSLTVGETIVKFQIFFL